MSYFSTLLNTYNVNMGRIEIIPAKKLKEFSRCIKNGKCCRCIR